MDKRQKRLGEILIDKGLITPQQLEVALEEQGRTRQFLGEILLRRKSIKEKDLTEALSEQFGMPFVSLKDKYIDWEMIKGFSPSLILDHKCLPIEKDNRSVTMAITNPLDVEALKKAEEQAMGLKIKLVLVSGEDIEEAIKRYQQHMGEDISKFFDE